MYCIVFDERITTDVGHSPDIHLDCFRAHVLPVRANIRNAIGEHFNCPVYSVASMRTGWKQNLSGKKVVNYRKKVFLVTKTVNLI